MIVFVLPAESCLCFWTCQNWAQADFSGLGAELSAPGHQSSALPEPKETVPWSPAASAAAAEDVVVAAAVDVVAAALMPRSWAQV